MMTVARLSLGVACLLALSACGGGGPSQQVIEEVPDRPAPSQQTPVDMDSDNPLDDFGTEPPDTVDVETSALLDTLSALGGTEIALSGLSIVVDPVTQRRVITPLDGVYDVASETLTLGSAGLALSSVISGDFVATSGFVQSTGPGIVGIATAETDMPLVGGAVFQGGAAGFVITSAAGFDLTNGKSLVNVNFETGSVTSELSDFTQTSQVSGDVLRAPLDAIVWRDAQIAGTGFSGGTLETIDLAQTSVDITGANTTVLAEGQFFGSDAPSMIPAEVGGLIYAEGDTGIVFGSFIAE